MAVIKSTKHFKYPFKGHFYTYETPEDVPLDERLPQKKVVFETECDIQENARLHNGTLLGADYTVYFPLELNPDATGSEDMYGPIKVIRGMRFSGTAYGYTVEGEVEIVRPSQLGACSVDIKVLTEKEI